MSTKKKVTFTLEQLQAIADACYERSMDDGDCEEDAMDDIRELFALMGVHNNRIESAGVKVI